jgi:hypothetical protein
MAATSYKIRGIAPPDLAGQPAAVKKMFWKWVADAGIKAKVKDLKDGLDKDGQTLRPIAAKTRRYRRSAMTPSGKGDPSAPPLIPAHMKSRTISLLNGRALTTHAEFYWKFDAWTGKEWGVVLAYQAAKGRDVIGLSPASTARVKAAAWRKWEAWKAGNRTVPARKAAQIAAAVPQVGSYDMSHATMGIGASDTARFAQGRWTGGMTAPEWQRYWRESARASIPGRPNPRKSPHPEVGSQFNRLLAASWGTGRTGQAGGAAKAPGPQVKPPGAPKQKVAMPPQPKRTPSQISAAQPMHANPVIARAQQRCRDRGIVCIVVERFDDIRKLFGKNYDTIPAGYQAGNDVILINPQNQLWKDPSMMRRFHRTQFFAVGEQDGIIEHEIGHYEHRHFIGINQFRAKAQIDVDHRQLIAAEVSRYATKNQQEFVAEVFAGLKLGKSYSREIMKYYKECGGVLP